MLFFQSENNIQVSIDHKFDYIKKKNLNMQPFLIAVGSIDEIEHFFVILGTAKYRFESIVMAIDFCLKLHFVLNLNYSPFCCQLWTFIQKYFFQIKTKYDVTYTSVTAALSDLNTNII